MSGVSLALGLVTGLVMAITGAGGGILAVPMLTFGAKLSVAEAAPAGLLAVGASALVGAALAWRRGLLRHRAALLMGGVGMVLAPLGLWLGKAADDRWLHVLLGAILLVVAWQAFRRAAGGARRTQGTACEIDPEQGRFVWTARCARALAATGGVAGFLSGLVGVGGGFVIVPALKRYAALAMQSTIATSLAVIALVSVSGVATAAATDRVPWAVALPFTAGALVGMLGGRRLAGRLPEQVLERTFGLVTAVVAAGMVLKGLRG